MDSSDIAILLDSRHLGGIETHVLHLTRGLRQFGYSPIILFYRRYEEAHPLEPLLQRHQLAFEYLEGHPYGVHHWLKQNTPQILHTHGYKAGIFGRLFAWLTKTPVVSTFHNGDQGQGLMRLYTWLDQASSRFSRNIAVSPEIASRLPGSVSLMNNFIDIPTGEFETGQKVAFVGRLSHEKGPDLFLQLAKHLPELSFTMYGSGPLHEALVANKTPNVNFAGQVGSMEPHWHKIGLLCITSRQEGLPLVALEAMAHGIPVLSFAVGALPQLVISDQNGWIITDGHLKQMSQQVRQWHQLSDETRNNLANQCIETVRKGYSYAAVIPKVLEFYKKAVNAKGYTWPEKNKQSSVSKQSCY